LLLVFNCTLWTAIRTLQQQRQQCPEGAGEWILFGRLEEVLSPSSASTAAFAFVILDSSWAALHFATEILRFLYLRKKPASDRQLETSFDSRVWLLSFAYTAWKGAKFKEWDWHFVCKCIVIISRIFKFGIWAYVVWTVEKMVVVNGYPTDEQKMVIWTDFRHGKHCGSLSPILSSVSTAQLAG
jgi:hypothetical protein